ncbi:mechanosensitive ion channel family protein [Heliophilum fasciatum]|uniref:Small conductance mechanosensitive channel n=1 Tax=Heliophilum fasciatum TaxID=35700 RepID=A0A4R2RLN2_9FIRM|nr:mechanosensitive ion channel family protein [Heliophilum fasciatum]MCW2278239.1 small conductance mechanosensitive channel [Heliophilum fasciatum]TCP63864.1 small conductance mechanosensitive channel [Heliophilum fasciatum]
MTGWLAEWVRSWVVAAGMPEMAGLAAAMVAGAVQVLVIVVLAWLVLRFGTMAIGQLFQQYGGKGLLDERRAATLDSLLRSVLFYTVFLFAGIVILDTVFGLQTGALLAGAGALGVAVGLGGQSLVKDIIAGFFIIFEDQYAVGDFVTLGKYTGIVEAIGLRVTKIRDMNGELHIIPNGLVKEVTNKSRGTMLVTADVPIPYEENVDRVIALMTEAAQELALAMEDVIREGPNVLGVARLGATEMVIRVTAKAVPLEHWKVERAMLRHFRLALDRAGINVPYPRQVMVPYGDTGGAVEAVVAKEEGR